MFNTLKNLSGKYRSEKQQRQGTALHNDITRMTLTLQQMQNNIIYAYENLSKELGHANPAPLGKFVDLPSMLHVLSQRKNAMRNRRSSTALALAAGAVSAYVFSNVCWDDFKDKATQEYLDKGTLINDGSVVTSALSTMGGGSIEEGGDGMEGGITALKCLTILGFLGGAGLGVAANELANYRLERYNEEKLFELSNQKNDIKQEMVIAETILKAAKAPKTTLDKEFALSMIVNQYA